MFPGVAKLGNICFGRKICVREAKMFLTSTPGKKNFVFRAAKFVSATHAGKHLHRQQCFGNNVSATMFPSLARPLDSRTRTTASTRFSHRTAAMSLEMEATVLRSNRVLNRKQ